LYSNLIRTPHTPVLRAFLTWFLKSTNDIDIDIIVRWNRAANTNTNTNVTSLKKWVLRIIDGVQIVRNKLTQRLATSVISIDTIFCLFSLAHTVHKQEEPLIDWERLHYRALRLILRGYRQRINRNDITTITKCLPHDKWSRFQMASLFLNMYNKNEPSLHLENIKKNFYSKRRKPGLMYSYNFSKAKIGKQSSRNWIGTTLCGICAPWSDRTLFDFCWKRLFINDIT